MINYQITMFERMWDDYYNNTRDEDLEEITDGMNDIDLNENEIFYFVLHLMILNYYNMLHLEAELILLWLSLNMSYDHAILLSN